MLAWQSMTHWQNKGTACAEDVAHNTNDVLYGGVLQAKWPNGIRGLLTRTRTCPPVPAAHQWH